MEKIANKYKDIVFNDKNFNIGGGLVVSKFASNRHEDAKSDQGKLTKGEAAQLFKKATGETTDFINNLIDYVFPNLEWHHAGKLPKAYGGGMKKTYFLNSQQVYDLAENWDIHTKGFLNSKKQKEKAKIEAAKLNKKRIEFLSKNATNVNRVLKENLPPYFYETNREMNGKYGWFSSYGKSYNMTEYFSGYSFKTKTMLDKYKKLINPM